MSDSEGDYDEEVAAIDRVYGIAEPDEDEQPSWDEDTPADYYPPLRAMPKIAIPKGYPVYPMAYPRVVRAKPVANAAAYNVRENYKDRIARETREREANYDIFPKLVLVCDEHSWAVTIGMAFNHDDIRRLTPPELLENEYYRERKINWSSMHRWIRGNTSTALFMDVDDEDRSPYNWVTPGGLSSIARSYAMRRRRANNYIAPCHVAMYNMPDTATLEYVVRCLEKCRTKGDDRQIWPINPGTLDELRAIIASFGCSETTAAAAAGVAMTDEPTDIIGRD